MTLEARHRVFGNLVDILANDYSVRAHYAGHCSQGVAQFWPRDCGVRIERHILRQASLSTLRVLAAHEVGHAWSRRRGVILPLESLLLVITLVLLAFGLPGLFAVGVIGFLIGHQVARYRALANLVEEVRADWFALQTGCNAEEFVCGLREAALLARRPWSDGVYLRARLARRHAGCGRGGLVFFSGCFIWLRPIRKTTDPSVKSLWRRVAHHLASV